MSKWYFAGAALLIIATMVGIIYKASSENTVGMLNMFDPSVVMKISGNKSAISSEKNKLNEIKIEANKLLEEKRNDGIIGSSLDAEVKIFCNSETFLRLSPCIDELKFLLIVSEASLVVADDDDQSSISIEVKPSDKEKCDRCWHHTGNLKKILDSNLCPRCIENVEGEGEKRKFF